jgi:hypothetical protein
MDWISLAQVLLAETSNKVEIDLNNVFAAGAGFCAGIYFFFKGFNDLKTKRTMENVPTSRIATGAVGTDVEISGSIVCDEDKLLTAPLSGEPCVFYALEIEKRVRRRNTTQWVTIDRLHSDEGFFVEDDSDANALVFAEGARIIQKGKPFTRYLDRYLQDDVRQRLKQAVMDNTGELKSFDVDDVDSKTAGYRLKEKKFVAGEQVYILGFADSGLRLAAQRKMDFKTFLHAKKMVKEDPELKKRFDKDRDGVLNPEELEWGAKVIGQRMFDKYNEDQFQKLYSRTKMIFKKAEPSLFLISNQKESEILKGLIWMTRLKLFGGPALTVACAVYMVTIYDDLMRIF